LSIFRKSVVKIQVLLKPDENPLHEDQCTFMIISGAVIFGMKSVSGKSFRGSRKTHFVFSDIFFVNEAVCEINIEIYCRAGQATDYNMGHAHGMLDY
jgi:hypothetical protein